MACWRCECGFKNCDTDECLNPKCTVAHKEAICSICGQKSDGELKPLKAFEVPIEMCTTCHPTYFRFYQQEYSYIRRVL